MTGKTVSHYKILEKLDGGGMGVVYKARDTKLDRTVALKFLPPQLGHDDEEKQRFIHEAKAASALEHNNICAIHEIGESEPAPGEPGGQLFIVMASYDGETLKKKIDRGHLSIEEAVDIATQVAAGLEKAQEKGIVHRDIKPANIMITEDGVAKILDFGLAKLHGQTKLTKAGSTLGTAAYMSPEQARGDEVDHRTDIFSLGAVLYEMLTGQIPFRGDYDQAIIYSVLNEEPTPISDTRRQVPRDVQAIVGKCLQKDPAERYQGAVDLIADLQNGAPVRPSLSLNMRNLRQFAGLTALSVVMLAAAFGYFTFFAPATSKERVPIAVVDFVNRTNEPELDGLSGMLITALEQSRRLNVFSRARMYDEFKQMNRPDLTFVDETSGIEISKRANISALAVATIRKFDDLYTIDFKVIDPQTGDRLFSTKVEGEGKKSIPGLLDQLSEKTRIDLKEQENQVQLASRGVADVTTSNLEAYQHYFKGEEFINKFEFGQAQDEFEKAIALDSTFALAYSRLAYAISWFSGELAKEPLRKALALIDRIAEKERYLLLAQDAQLEAGFQASLSILKEMERIYPDDKEMLFNIGDGNFHTGQYTQAVEYFKKVLLMDPTSERTLSHLAGAYQNVKNYDKLLEVTKRWVSVTGSDFSYLSLGAAYAATGRFELGLKSLEQARDLYPENYAITSGIVQLYTYQGKYDKAEVEAKTLVAEDQPAEARQWGYADLSEIYAYLGRYREIVEAYDKKIRLAWATNDTASAIGHQIAKANHMIYGWNDVDSAWQEAAKTVRFQKSHGAFDYWYGWAELNVYSGKYFEAEETAKGQGRTQHQVVQSLIHGAKGECRKAKSFADMRLRETPGFHKALLLYRVAECQYEIGQWQEAIEPLLKVQDVYTHVPLGLLAVFYPKSFFLLGKIYEKTGDKQSAIENTEKFLDLWKDADPDLPDLIDAKKRLARLRVATAK